MAGVLSSGLIATGWLERVDFVFFDLFTRERNQSASFEAPVSEEIAVVTVTNQDVMTLNRPFPWPRDEQSVIFEKIAAESPSVVAVDLLYPEPSTLAADSLLGRRLEECRNVVTSIYFDDKAKAPSKDAVTLLDDSVDRMAADFTVGRLADFPGHPALPTAAIASGIDRVGHAHSVRDSDGVMRRLPLVIRTNDRVLPSLALQAVLMHWEIEWSQVRLTKSHLEIVGSPVTESTLRIPVDEHGTMVLNMPPEHRRQFQGADVFSLMEKRHPEFSKKIVFVGSVVTGHGDVHPTPVEPETPGLLINAVAANQILQASFLTKAPIAIRVAACLVCSWIVAIVIWFFRPLVGTPIALGILGLLVFLCFLVFKEASFWLPPFALILASLLTTGFLALDFYRSVVLDHRRIVNAFSRYIGPNLGKILSEDPEAFDMGPRREMVTVFFSDIVSYTKLSESLESEEMISMLNTYFDAMTEVAFEYGATVSKYIGDGMMVFFNQPIPQEDHAERAVRMGLSMLDRLGGLNKEFEKQGLPTFSVRMGINSGYAHVGNVGSAGFSDFTIIGPVVNLAARIMERAEPNEILVSARTQALSESSAEFEGKGSFDLKGVAGGQQLFRAVQQTEITRS